MSKEAMKLALEALIADTPVKAKDPQMQAVAITALQEALAEQPAQYLADDIEWEEDALAEQSAQQEPVALPEKIYEFVPTPDPVKWHHPECEGECIACRIERVVREACGSQGLGYLQQHLTSPPAQRKPLTVVEIMREWNSANNSVVNFARAIEAAHGIKENT